MFTETSHLQVESLSFFDFRRKDEDYTHANPKRKRRVRIGFCRVRHARTERIS